MAEQQLAQKQTFIQVISSHTDVLLAVGIVSILMFMIIPLPSFILDFLLAVNITGSLLILLIPIYINKPVEFSVFPGVLLLFTLFRLSLNIASTRLILGDAYAGALIEAFGSFVVKGNYVVGLIIFVIVVIINFTVITKGSGRVAEVAARFTLDAMPGKQMAIDADLNAGVIEEDEARTRRELIRKEADFYGAMDGASKFVRGDAIAGVLITGINIVAGLIIGVFQHNMSASEALDTYTILTVGDGLVSQIPALLISTSAGIIVTRASSEETLAKDLTGQLLTTPKASFVAGGVLVVLGLVPGMPTLPFLLLGAANVGLGYISKNDLLSTKTDVQPQEDGEESLEPESLESFLQVDPLEIEIGYGLIPLIDSKQGGDLLNSITMIRKQIAQEYGIIVPPIRIRDNVQLNSTEYVFKIKGNELARGEVMTGYYLALTPEGEDEALEGIQTVDPTYNLPAYWLNEEQKEKAELKGYAVVDSSAVVSTHLLEILKRNAYKILDRQAVQGLLDNLKEVHATVVDELVPNVMGVGIVQNVLKNLLKENIPIKDLSTILETLADRGAFTKEPDILTEYVRVALAETISAMHRNEKGEIVAIMLDAKLEEHITGSINAGRQPGQSLGLPPQSVNELYEQTAAKVRELISMGGKAMMITGPTVRRYVKAFYEPVLPEIVVVSIAELSPNLVINSIGSIGLPSYD